MGAMPRRQLLSWRTGADWREVRGTIERVGGPERGAGRTVGKRWVDHREGVGGS